MNPDQSQASTPSSVESLATTSETQAAAHANTLSPELLNLISGGDGVPCW